MKVFNHVKELGMKSNEKRVTYQLEMKENQSNSMKGSLQSYSVFRNEMNT